MGQGRIVYIVQTVINYSYGHDIWEVTTALTMPTVYLLDYVAGNVRSLVNAIEKVGYTVEWVRRPEDVANATVCAPPSHQHTATTLSECCGDHISEDQS